MAKTVLTLFADHYPERLGHALMYASPIIFQGLWSAVKLFAAPETVRKVLFVKHNDNDRTNKFHSVNIKGDTFHRLCKEIDEARIPEVRENKNWWALEPLSPVPHYGARIIQHSVNAASN